jgi:hypothetical protein
MQQCHVGDRVQRNGLVICAHLLLRAMLVGRHGERGGDV